MEKAGRIDITKPTVGRIVHYIPWPGRSAAKTCRAAIVTDALEFQENDPRPTDLGPDQCLVGLCILRPTGMYFSSGVVQDPDTKKPGTWHWPERE